MFYYSFIKEPIDVERLRVEIAAGITTTALGEVTLDGTDVVLGFDDPLSELQVVALAGILQAHTGEPLANYRLSGTADSPGTTDYKAGAYFAVPTFNVIRNGEVVQLDYYATRDGETGEYSEIVVSEAITYERNEHDIATSRSTVATFYREDDTTGETRTRVEYFELWQGVEADRASRRNALNAFRAVAYGAFAANAIDFLAAAESSGDVTRYELGDLQSLIDWVNASAEPYVTGAAKTALTNSLKGVSMETIDLSPRSLEVKLIQGDDYLQADGRAINVVKAAEEVWPADLTGALVELVVAFAGAEVARFAGTVVVAAGAGQQLRVELAAADTALLPPGRCYFDLSVTLAGKHYTLARGPITVLKEVAVSLASQLPAAPTALAAAAGANDPETEVDLSWAHAGAGVTGYKVERKTAATPFALIATIANPATLTYTDTDRTTGTEYTYRVRAYNALGNSAYSNEDSATPAAASGLITFSDPMNDLAGWTTIAGDPAAAAGVLSGTLSPSIIQRIGGLGANRGFSVSFDVAALPDGSVNCYVVDAVTNDGYCVLLQDNLATQIVRLDAGVGAMLIDGVSAAPGDAVTIEFPTAAPIVVKINGVPALTQPTNENIYPAAKDLLLAITGATGAQLGGPVIVAPL